MHLIALEHLESVVTDVRTAASTSPEEALAALDRLAAWCHAARVECVRALDEAGSLQLLAASPLRSQRDLDGLARSAEVARQSTALFDDVVRGSISAAHLEEFGHTLRRLDAPQRKALLHDEARVRAIASSSTAAEFARFLRREERRLGRTAGTTTLEQQQRDVRLTARTERESGMRVYTLRLDPLSAVSFEQRIDAAVEALFHDAAPAGCPSDPIERFLFLRAHALLRLSEGRGGRTNRGGRSEIMVVIDTAMPDGVTEPTVDWGIPVEIPERVLATLFPEARIVPVIIRNGVVLHAPGELGLGRSTRLANRAQRRALRAMYATCAIPGCEVRFQHCRIHHVVWWRHGGATDLGNLLPLCHRHHRQVHLDNWQLALDPQRTLRITMPDGRTRTTGPPRRVAA